MATITVNAGTLIVCEYQNGTLNKNTNLDPLSSGNWTLWAGYETKNYVTRIQLSTAKIASSITFHLRSGPDGGVNTGSVVMKYKLLDSENTSYNNANTSTAYDGTITWSSTDYSQNTITVTRTIPAGTHYLYIWTGNSSATELNYGSFRFFASGDYTTVVTYVELIGAVRIDNGSNFDVYTVWIDNGTSWVQYIPYVDNGTTWDMCG